MVVHLISSPRTISTALMYSFNNREDFDVVDEPLYARYLSNTGNEHPGRDEILMSQGINEVDIFKDLSSRGQKDHIFIKNMASHLKDVEIDLYKDFTNVILFRDPARIIHSFSKVIHKPQFKDLGIKWSYDIFIRLKELNKKVIVINSDHLLDDPAGGLQLLCDHINISMTPRMLTWAAGPKNIDGVWAKYWYDAVHQSTGFGDRNKSPITLSPSENKLFLEAKPYYNYLSEHSIL